MTDNNSLIGTNGTDPNTLIGEGDRMITVTTCQQ